MQLAVLTLFPQMFAAITEHGVTGRAVRESKLTLTPVNPRDFTTDRHGTVDDRPFGGGPGMVMKIEPLAKALASAKSIVGEDALVVYLTPQGEPLTQGLVDELAQRSNVVLIAGRYEGIDERFIEAEVHREIRSEEHTSELQSRFDLVCR